MPMYDFTCDRCGVVQTVITGSLEEAEDLNGSECNRDECDGTLTREFPRANFSVQGGTPKHHR